MSIEFPKNNPSGNSAHSTEQSKEVSSLEATIEDTHQPKESPSPKTPQLDSMRESTGSEHFSPPKEDPLNGNTEAPSQRSTHHLDNKQDQEGFAYDFESFYDAIRDDDFILQRLKLAFVPQNQENSKFDPEALKQLVSDPKQSKHEKLDAIMRAVALKQDNVQLFQQRMLAHLVNLDTDTDPFKFEDHPLHGMSSFLHSYYFSKLIDETLALNNRDAFTDRDIQLLQAFSRDLYREALSGAVDSFDEGQAPLAKPLSASDIVKGLSSHDAAPWTIEGGWHGGKGGHSTRLAFVPFDHKDNGSSERILKLTVYDMSDSSLGYEKRATYTNNKTDYTRPTTYIMKLSDFEDFHPELIKKMNDFHTFEKNEFGNYNDPKDRARHYFNHLHDQFPGKLQRLPEDHPSISILPQQTEGYCSFDSKFGYLRDEMSEKGFFNWMTLISRSAAAILDKDSVFNVSADDQLPRTKGYAFNIDGHTDKLLKKISLETEDDRSFIDNMTSYYDHSLTGRREALRKVVTKGFQFHEESDGIWSDAPTVSEHKKEQLRSSLLTLAEALKSLDQLERIHVDKRELLSRINTVTQSAEILASKVDRHASDLSSSNHSDQQMALLRFEVDVTELEEDIKDLKLLKESLFGFLSGYLETYHPDEPTPPSHEKLASRIDDNIDYAEQIIKETKNELDQRLSSQKESLSTNSSRNSITSSNTRLTKSLGKRFLALGRFSKKF